MPSPKQHKKHKDKDKTKKFSCPRDPKHSKCVGKWTEFQKTCPEDGVKWIVGWAPCQKEVAVAFMKERHGHTYNPHSRHDHDPKPEQKHSKKKHPTKHSNSSEPSSSRDNIAAAQEHRLHQNIPTGAPIGAPIREQNQHQQIPPATNSARDAHGAMLLNTLKQGSNSQTRHMDPTNQRNIRDWMAGRPYSNMASDDHAAVPPQNMATAPAMPSPWEAEPSGHQQKHRRHKSHHHNHKGKPEQEPFPSTAIPPPRTVPADMASPMGMDVPLRMPSPRATIDRQQQHHHQMPTRHPSHAQGPQPSTIIPPDASVPPFNVPSAPTAPNGQQRTRHHGRSRPEQDPQPPASMPPAPAPVVYTPQAPSGAQRSRCPHHKSSRQPEAEVGEAPQPPAAKIPPPGSMRERMANLAEEAMSVPHPGGPEDYDGDVRAARPSNMPPPPPPPMSTTMPVGPAAEDISLLPAAQPGPGMSRLPRTHSIPTAPPQAGEMAAAAGGGPGPQAMPARSSRRAPPKAGPAMTPRPRMEPPPMSMPPFPGTDPGDPVSFDPSMSPPPSAPTPPVPDGALD